MWLVQSMVKTDMRHEVVSARPERHLKRLRLEPGALSLVVPRSASARTGDSVTLRKGEAWVTCTNGACQFIPVFAVRERLLLGDLRIDLLIKEITEFEEHEAVRSLAEYHYRGSQLHGRTAILIARSFDPRYPRVLGYIELATSFYMNKARARILDSPFSSNGVSWDRWDKETTRRYVNLMVRVARSVVYPEFRGMGLGQVLLRQAIEFAATRWHTAGTRPLFMEISADMLKFVPFAEKAGMLFIGETEGNLDRIYKDMEYLTRNAARVERGEILPHHSFGIVDQQVARMNRTLALMEDLGLSRSDVLLRLRKLSRSRVLKDFALFHNIVSLPKPTYMKGLNPDADRFLLDRVRSVEPIKGKPMNPVRVEPLVEPIKLSGLTLSFASKVRRTAATHSVGQAFGISLDTIETTVLNRLSVDIQPGQIVLVLGPSGSGKTTLINLLSREKGVPGNGAAEGIISWPKNYDPGVFRQPRSQKALVELLSQRNVPSALSLMGLVGLSDAFSYLKRFDELSRGQQYRAMLAMMIAKGSNVWLIDEFCANLDRITACVVAHKLQRMARSLGVTVIAAAPHCETFVSALQPDQAIILTTAWEHKIITGDQLVASVSPRHPHRSRVISLSLRPDLLDAVVSGTKTSTIRAGRKNVQEGLIVLESQHASVLAYVTRVTCKRLKSLNDEDARRDGYSGVEELIRELRSIYPTLSSNSLVTQVEFRHVYGDISSDWRPNEALGQSTLKAERQRKPRIGQQQAESFRIAASPSGLARSQES